MSKTWFSAGHKSPHYFEPLRTGPDHHDFAHGREHAGQRGDIDLMRHPHPVRFHARASAARTSARCFGSRPRSPKKEFSAGQGLDFELARRPAARYRDSGTTGCCAPRPPGSPGCAAIDRAPGPGHGRPRRGFAGGAVAEHEILRIAEAGFGHRMPQQQDVPATAQGVEEFSLPGKGRASHIRPHSMARILSIWSTSEQCRPAGGDAVPGRLDPRRPNPQIATAARAAAGRCRARRAGGKPPVR